jgi:hypothetical protein
MRQAVEIEAMTTPRRMKGLGKLSDFGKTSDAPAVVPEPPSTAAPAPEVLSEAPKPASAPTKPASKALTTVNIKLLRSQHEWLNDIARQVRDNNTEPVPASDRVYPQHLIQLAIDLIKSSDVDWEQVRSVEEIRQQLNLKAPRP